MCPAAAATAGAGGGGGGGGGRDVVMVVVVVVALVVGVAVGRELGAGGVVEQVVQTRVGAATVVGEGHRVCGVP